MVPIEELTMKDIMLNKDAPDDSEPVISNGNETADRYGPPDDSSADSEPVVPKGNETDDRYGPPDDSGDDLGFILENENDPRFQIYNSLRK